MQELDLKFICTLLLAKIRWILVSVAIGVLLFGSYAYFFVPETYTATSKIYIRNTKEDYDINGTTSSNLTAGQQLVEIYSVHMKTEPVISQALAQLDGRVTAAQLRSGSAAAAVGETSWITISVTLGDPQLAIDACTALSNASVNAFADLEAASAVVREYPQGAPQATPNVIRTAILGALLGAVVSIVVILTQQMMNNTVHDKHDLIAHVNVPVLGEIPSFDLAAAAKKGGRTHA